MDTRHLEKIVDETLQHVSTTLTSKGKEYATDDDRLHNFVVGAQLQGVTPKEACMGYLTKHLVSISDMVKEPAEAHTLEQWDEKIGDALVYLTLMRAIVWDEIYG